MMQAQINTIGVIGHPNQAVPIFVRSAKKHEVWVVLMENDIFPFPDAFHWLLHLIGLVEKRTSLN